MCSESKFNQRDVNGGREKERQKVHVNKRRQLKRENASCAKKKFSAHFKFIHRTLLRLQAQRQVVVYVHSSLC